MITFLFKFEESCDVRACDPSGCFFELCIQMAIIMIGRQISNNFVQMFLAATGGCAGMALARLADATQRRLNAIRLRLQRRSALQELPGRNLYLIFESTIKEQNRIARHS
jgi:hypothetical protein